VEAARQFLAGEGDGGDDGQGNGDSEEVIPEDAS
jgi:hypothetical protein